MEKIEACALVLDYDGIVVDSGPKGHKVFETVCHEKGIQSPSYEQFRKRYSSGPFAANLRAHGVLGEFDELTLRVEELWPTYPSSPLKEGVWEFLERCQNEEIPLALATRLHSAYADQSIRKRNLEQFFLPHMYTGLEEKATTLQKLSFQCGPSRLLLLTDTLLDIKEAQSVACRVGACMSGWGWPKALRAAKPDFLFEKILRVFDSVQFVKV